MENKIIKTKLSITVIAKILLWIVILSMILLLTRCSVTKHIQKNDQSTSTKMEVQAEEKTKKETQSDLISKTMVSELLDTTVTTASTTINGSRPLTDLQSGNTLVLEDGGQKVEVSVDSKGTIHAAATVKPQTIPVLVKKITVNEQQLKQTIKASSDSTGKENIKTKTNTEILDRVVTKTFGLPWWLWILLALAVIAYLIWKKYLPKFWV